MTVRVVDLPASWRTLRDALQPYAPAAAEAFARVAIELEAALAEDAAATLTLSEAARESGFSADHIRHLVAAGTIPNAGRRGAPRVRRHDLPRRAAKATTTAYDPAQDAMSLMGRKRAG